VRRLWFSDEYPPAEDKLPKKRRANGYWDVFFYSLLIDPEEPILRG
jgi:hypothetical protein